MSGFDGMRLVLAQDILRREGYRLVYAGPRINRYKKPDDGQYKFYMLGDFDLTIKRAEYRAT